MSRKKEPEAATSSSLFLSTSRKQEFQHKAETTT